MYEQQGKITSKQRKFVTQNIHVPLVSFHSRFELWHKIHSWMRVLNDVNAILSIRSEDSSIQFICSRRNAHIFVKIDACHFRFSSITLFSLFQQSPTSGNWHPTYCLSNPHSIHIHTTYNWIEFPSFQWIDGFIALLLRNQRNVHQFWFEVSTFILRLQFYHVYDVCQNVMIPSGTSGECFFI